MIEANIKITIDVSVTRFGRNSLILLIGTGAVAEMLSDCSFV